MEGIFFYESDCLCVKKTTYVNQMEMKKNQWPLMAILLGGKKIIHLYDFISKKSCCLMAIETQEGEGEAINGCPK